MIMVPYKSVAAALMLVLVLGPIGLFYSSFIGGVIMSILGLVAIGTMASMRSPLPMATVYLFCMIWAMASVRLYNRQMLKIAISGCLSTSKRKAKIWFGKQAHVSEKNSTPATEEPGVDEHATWKL